MRAGVAATLGFSSATLEIPFAFLLSESCFQIPYHPFFPWSMLSFWWRVGDNISENAYETFHAVQHPDVLYGTRFFLSSLLAVMSFLLPRCSEIS